MKKYDVRTANGIIKVTEEDIEDIMCTALEGGIGYLACLDNTEKEFVDAPKDEPYSETCAKIILRGGEIRLICEEDNESYYLNLNKFLTGIQLWIDGGYDMYGAVDGDELDCGSIDSECADCIIQLALFDDIVYG